MIQKEFTELVAYLRESLPRQAQLGTDDVPRRPQGSVQQTTSRSESAGFIKSASVLNPNPHCQPAVTAGKTALSSRKLRSRRISCSR